MAGAATGCMRSWARGVYGGLREEEEEEDEANEASTWDLLERDVC